MDAEPPFPEAEAAFAFVETDESLSDDPDLTMDKRDAGAAAAGRCAASALTGIAAGAPEVPCSRKWKKYFYVLLMDKRGGRHSPARLFRTWGGIARRVQWYDNRGHFRLADRSVFHGWPSFRECRANCAGAGVPL